MVQLARYFTVTAAKGQANASGGVEYHDGDAILIRKHVQSFSSSRSNPLDMRLHAAAYIDEQQNIDGHIFAGEVTNGNNFAIDAQHEITAFEASDGPAVPINHLSVDPRHGDVAFEDGLVRKYRRTRRQHQER